MCIARHTAVSPWCGDGDGGSVQEQLHQAAARAREVEAAAAVASRMQAAQWDAAARRIQAAWRRRAVLAALSEAVSEARHKVRY